MHDFECAEVQVLLHSLLDGELDEARADALRQHLDACENCLDEADLIDALKQLVHRSCRSCEAPDALRARIVTQVRSVSWTRVEYGEA